MKDKCLECGRGLSKIKFRVRNKNKIYKYNHICEECWKNERRKTKRI